MTVLFPDRVRLLNTTQLVLPMDILLYFFQIAEKISVRPIYQINASAHVQLDIILRPDKFIAIVQRPRILINGPLVVDQALSLRVLSIKDTFALRQIWWRGALTSGTWSRMNKTIVLGAIAPPDVQVEIVAG